jgi:hypothetical protein
LAYMVVYPPYFTDNIPTECKLSSTGWLLTFHKINRLEWSLDQIRQEKN